MPQRGFRNDNLKNFRPHHYVQAQTTPIESHTSRFKSRVLFEKITVFLAGFSTRWVESLHGFPHSSISISPATRINTL